MSPAGDIIGYYAKSQTEPKPIYAHSRVALQSRRAQGFPHDFINANTVCIYDLCMPPYKTTH